MVIEPKRSLGPWETITCARIGVICGWWVRKRLIGFCASAESQTTRQTGNNGTWTYDSALPIDRSISPEIQTDIYKLDMDGQLYFCVLEVLNGGVLPCFGIRWVGLGDVTDVICDQARTTLPNEQHNLLSTQCSQLLSSLKKMWDHFLFWRRCCFDQM